MTRSTAALALVCLVLLCPVRADDDALPIIEKAFAAAQANLAVARNYVFHERVEERRLNRKGEVKKRKSWTWDVTLLDSSEYRRLIAIDDRPLFAKTAAKEQRRLEKKIRKMRNETPKQREKRLARVEKERKRAEELLEEITKAFVFRLTGEEAVDGVATYVVSAEPREDYEPIFRETKALTKVRGTVWIAKESDAWVKLELETIDDITWGIIFKLHKGAKVGFTQRRFNAEVWMTDRWYARARAKRALVFGFHREYTANYSNYRRFTADSSVIHEGATH